MSTETCIVLAGGRGVRLHSLTGGRNKHASLFGGKTALHHVLEPVLATPSVRDVIVVTQPDSQGWIREILASLGCPDIRVCIQPEPNGTLAAVWAALPSVESDVFAVHFADNLFGWRHLPELSGFLDTGAVAELYVLDGLERFSDYAVVDVESTAVGTRATVLVDKPASLDGFRDPRVATGFYRFEKQAFLAASAGVTRSPRGEFELPEVVRRLLGSGSPVMVRNPGVSWVDFGTPETFRRAEGVLNERTAIR